MRILLISNMYPSNNYPHYGVFVKNVGDILRKSGNDVDVISIKKNDSVIKKMICYIKFYIQAIFKGCFGKYDAVYGHYLSHIGLALVIIHLFNTNIPIIANTHGNDIVPETSKDKKFTKLVKKVLCISDVVIAPSKYFKQVLQEEYGCDGAKIIIYPSGGVNKKIFFPMSSDLVRNTLKLEKKTCYIGYVSRLEKAKGWDILLKAFRTVMDSVSYNVKLIVVGSGEEEEDFNKLADHLNLNEQIIKYDLMAQEQISYVYNALDLFVFPTYRKSESLGLVGLEAMSCGVITVLPDKYGPTSYGIDKVNCIQFKSGDVSSLAGAIKNALNISAEEKRELSRNALKTAEKFSGEKTKKNIINVFSELRDNN